MDVRIKTANESVVVQRLGDYRAFVEYMVAGRWDARVNWTVSPRVTARAYVLRSAWVADCPTCAGNMVVEPGEPYFCPDCAMQGNGFQACAVVWPEQWAEIERLLLARPDPNTRNWLIGETLDDLARENAEHGVGE
jgi:hypothetical protein